MAGELDVSRTPVREALSRLHVEGLVERHPDGGYAPSVPDLDEIVELYEVRGHLEEATVVKDHHDRAQVLTLRDEWSAMGSDPQAVTADPEFVLLDEDFHLRLAASAGNRSLVSVLAGVNERIRIVRVHDFLARERVVATIEQHLGIVEAVLAGRPDAAVRALRGHLQESREVVHERAATAIARMLTGRRDAR